MTSDMLGCMSEVMFRSMVMYGGVGWHLDLWLFVNFWVEFSAARVS